MYPAFQASSADRYQVYSHLEQCGNDRVKFITDMLYSYKEGAKDLVTCYRTL